MAEHRAGVEFRVQGRTLSGVALRYGDISPDFRERFEPGAFGPVDRIAINLQHDRALVLAPDAILADSPRELRVRAELPEASAALKLVRRGALNGFSVEFHSQRERREGGIRVIERAALSGLALVDRGAYPQSTAEVRARSGRTLRQRIPSDADVACECAGDVACKWARFVGDALTEAIQGAYDDAVREILAVRGNYGTPLASKSRGTVRARVEGSDAVVEVDLPAGPDGEAIVRDIETTGAVVIRPYLDRNGSEAVIEEKRAPGEPEQVMVYSKVAIRSFVVGATDARQGWPEPELVPTPAEYMESRAAPAPRRRRVWL